VAKERGKSGGIVSAETKMGDIITAAKSTMKDADYSGGYPRQPGPDHLENMNFSGKKSGGRK
jgi:hypothetical protein